METDTSPTLDTVQSPSSGVVLDTYDEWWSLAPYTVVTAPNVIAGPPAWQWFDFFGEGVLAEPSGVYDSWNSYQEGTIARRLGPAYENGTVSVDVLAFDHDEVGVVSRFWNGAYYRFSVRPILGVARIYRRSASGQFTQLFEAPLDPAFSDWSGGHTLYLTTNTVNGNPFCHVNIIGAIDGVQAFAATDHCGLGGLNQSGEVGIHDWATSNAFFDNLLIEPGCPPGRCVDTDFTGANQQSNEILEQLAQIMQRMNEDRMAIIRALGGA